MSHTSPPMEHRVPPTAESAQHGTAGMTGKERPHGQPTSYAPTTAEGVMKELSSHMYGSQEMKERMSATADDLTQKAQKQAKEVKRQANYAWADTQQFIRKHPWLVLGLVLATMATGMLLAGSGFTLGLFGKSAFGGYRRNSPQYRAHQALDTILESYYGPSSMSSSFGSGGGSHRASDAYHYLLDTLGHTKDRIMGSPTESSGSISDYVKDSLGKYGGGRKSWYEAEHEVPSRSWADTIKYYTGTSDEAKIESAEKRLREVLRSRGRGDM